MYKLTVLHLTTDIVAHNHFRKRSIPVNATAQSQF